MPKYVSYYGKGYKRRKFFNVRNRQVDFEIGLERKGKNYKSFLVAKPMKKKKR